MRPVGEPPIAPPASATYIPRAMHSPTSNQQLSAGAEVTAIRPAVVVLGLGAAVVLLLSFLLVPGGLPAFDLCLLQRLTGLPCPSCGLTRAFCAISHGDPAAAWHYNPFAFPLYAGVLVTPFWAAWKWYHPHRALLSGRGRRVAWRLLLLLGTGMILHDLWRILRGWW